MFQTCSTREFNEKTKNKRIICIGAGKRFLGIIDVHKWCIEFVVDNDETKWGKKIECSNCDNILIRNWEFLENNISNDSILLITPIDYKELLSKVENTPKLNTVPCFVYQLFWALDYDEMRESYQKKRICFDTTKIQIPKIIHFFWFSDDPYPEKVQKCIDSWKKYCPDYEIRKWNLSNYDYTVNDYVREAIENGKWQFASDYARADVIYRYGGIYLDTDVEVVKSFDELLCHKSFIGFENPSLVDPGSGFGAVAHNRIIKEFRDLYNDRHFVKKDGTFDVTGCPIYYTDVLKRKGLKMDGSYQVIEGMAVYPFDYFCPHSNASGMIYKKQYTYSVHHHTASWFLEKDHEQMIEIQNLVKNHYINKDNL